MIITMASSGGVYTFNTDCNLSFIHIKKPKQINRSSYHVAPDWESYLNIKFFFTPSTQQRSSLGPCRHLTNYISKVAPHQPPSEDSTCFACQRDNGPFRECDSRGGSLWRTRGRQSRLNHIEAVRGMAKKPVTSFSYVHFQLAARKISRRIHRAKRQ